MDREQQVRERAYAIWNAEGRPAGHEDEHWRRAQREISEEGSGSPATGEAGANETAQTSESASAESANESAAEPPTTARRKRAVQATTAKGTAKRTTRTSKSKANKSPS